MSFLTWIDRGFLQRDNRDVCQQTGHEEIPFTKQLRIAVHKGEMHASLTSLSISFLPHNQFDSERPV